MTKYRTFLPMLPASQNRLLFGDQGEAPPECPDAAFIPMCEQIEQLTGLEIGSKETVETPTWLPDLSEYGGPKKAAEALLRQRWGNHLDTLDELADTVAIAPPKTIIKRPGWTCYPNNGRPYSCDFPSDETFFFDTETYVVGGGHPVMATAVSKNAWYLWLHPQILVPWNDEPFKPQLIPLGQDKVFVAHNAMFDMSKVEEAYSPTNDKRPAAICTMAIHSTMSGMGGDQVLTAFKALKKRNSNVPWLDKVCQDSLAAVVKHYTGIEMSKDIRDIFVSGSLSDIHNSLDRLIDYALKDTHVLNLVWAALWPEFKYQCPSIITVCGMLELSRSLLTVDKNYHQKVAANTVMYGIEMKAIQSEIDREVEAIMDSFNAGTLDYENDPWLKQLDWTPAKSGKNKGMPMWWRKTKGLVKLGSNLAPLVLRMTWKGEPLVFHKKLKWGFIDRGGISPKFQKLPHESGPKANVGSPLSKQFAKFADSGVLGSNSEVNIPMAISRLTYWQSYESRFRDEYVMGCTDDKDAIVPVTQLIKTLTGRQVHKLWLTAAQAKPGKGLLHDKEGNVLLDKDGKPKKGSDPKYKGKLGSDMFHVMQPPEGMMYVSGDEDTEEVRIAGIWGDFYQGLGVGCTPMSQMAIMGVNTKDIETATDAHSVTARLAQIDRKEAKTANFRDIFGGGRKTQELALMAAHPDWPAKKIAEKVSNILDAKRGERKYGVYQGGTDSSYHNQACIIADSPNFRLPSTGRMIPHVVNQANDQSGSFYTSRYNFPVQGTGADILHVLASMMPVFAGMRGIGEDRFGYVLARHDEIGYNVMSDSCDEFAEVFNAVHTLAWAIFLEGLGMRWLPQPICRLSAINIDHCVRKEVSAHTDAGYKLGYQMPDGREVH